MNEISLRLCAYLGNVMAIALPLAILEIWLEKYKGKWGGEFNPAFWGRKVRVGFILKVAEKTYVTVYHLIVFVLVLPGLLILEFVVFWYVTKSGFWTLNVSGIRFVPSIFLPAVWLGITVVEDFLWFALNWRYRGALRRLFRGEMAWHTRWVRLSSSVRLPRFYITVPLFVLAVLAAEHVLVCLVRPF